MFRPLSPSSVVAYSKRARNEYSSTSVLRAIQGLLNALACFDMIAGFELALHYISGTKQIALAGSENLKQAKESDTL